MTFSFHPRSICQSVLQSSIGLRYASKARGILAMSPSHPARPLSPSAIASMLRDDAMQIAVAESHHERTTVRFQLQFSIGGL
jgi:hypothetical protein